MLRLALLAACLVLAPGAWAGVWILVGRGDCPGPLLRGSAGEVPDREFCTPEFDGKTALCYTQNCNPGCDYVDVPTRDCRGGAELVDVYTCRAGSGGQ
jgi:hypothetical protein